MRKTWWCGCPSRPSPATRVILSVCVVQGMLLDLDAATLEVFVNGDRRGFLAQPGMTMDAPSSAHHGREVARLEGPLRWAADIDAQVSINGPLPPPS